MARYRLLDIDNCISNDGWRIPRIDWSLDDRFMRYHVYHCLSPWDAFGNRDLFEGCNEEIIILTCRPLHYRAMTVEVLQRQGVFFKHLLMRNDSDQRPSTLIKRSFLEQLWEYGVVPSNIDAAFDDRQEVIDMYKSCGIRCAERRALHGISAYHNPVTGVNHADGSKS